jgi:hypothetical protein
MTDILMDQLIKAKDREIATWKAEYRALEAERDALRSERDSYLVNLTSVQARCTELLQSLRDAKAPR